jgi:D-glycero-D-manno-heptose 1,7-bisphosphate phosphatase
VSQEFITEEGIWCDVRTDLHGVAPRPALFLDRDGVIVDEVGYLHRPEDVRLIDGAADCIAAANRAGVPVVIVTNQSGIGRGYYGWEDFAATQNHLLAELVRRSAWIDGVLACPFHAEARGAYAVADHPGRKPNPGMLLAAAEALPIDLASSWIVGDTASDLEAGRRAGLAGGIHVTTGNGAAENASISERASLEFTTIAATGIADVTLFLPSLLDVARPQRSVA